MFILSLYQLITDVAKDLDLTLQDLSPDIEIFTDSTLSSSVNPSKPQIISALRKHTPNFNCNSNSNVGGSAQPVRIGGHTSPPSPPPTRSSPPPPRHAAIVIDHPPPDNLHVAPHSQSYQRSKRNHSIDTASKANSNSHQSSSRTACSAATGQQHNTSTIAAGDNHHHDNDHADAQNRRLRGGVPGAVSSSSKPPHQAKANGHTKSEQHKVARGWGGRSEQQPQNGCGGVPLLRRRPGEGSSSGRRRNGGGSAASDLLKDDIQCLECEYNVVF